MSLSYSLDHSNMNIVQYDYSHLPASCQEGFSSFILLDFGIKKAAEHAFLMSQMQEMK